MLNNFFGFIGITRTDGEDEADGPMMVVNDLASVRVQCNTYNSCRPIDTFTVFTLNSTGANDAAKIALRCLVAKQAENKRHVF